MGSRYLTDLADVVRGAGLPVTEINGWHSRGRSSGGFNNPQPTYIVCHHTASNPGSDGASDANYIATGSDIAPISQVYLDRTGRVWICAAGACNNAGSGGPLGTVPQDSMNTYSLAIEAANNGVGETWPEVQQQAYQRLVQAFCQHYGISSNNVVAHFEWAPSRKVDPRGPSRWGGLPGSVNMWDMNAFRSDVRAGWNGGVTPPQPQPEPPPSHAYAHDIPLPTLAYGSSGPQVTHLINDLKFWGWYPAQYMGDTNDGNFGSRAQSGVRNMQTTLHEQADGVYGPVTAQTYDDWRTEIDNVPPPSTTTAYPGEGNYGCSSTTCRAWQDAMIAKGYISDTSANRDGVWGNGMHNACLAMQDSWKWKDADGVGGPHTWDHLQSRPNGPCPRCGK